MVSRNQEKLQRILRGVIIFLTVFVSLNKAANYDGYKVYRLYPDTLEKIALLKSLDGVTGYDFWQEPRSNASELMVAPKQQNKFEELMTSAQMRTDIVIDDVATKLRRDAIQRDQLERTGSGRRSNFSDNWRSFSFDRYFRYKQMWEFTESIVSGKSAAKIFVVGMTSEGREIFGVKLSTSSQNPVIVIDGGIHAREWAAPMSVLYILKNLVDNKELLKKVSFYIVPLVNPDGYEFSHEGDRLWRKTMSKHFSGCLGVDGNRNFDSHWNEFGADSDPCKPAYSGPHAFSEPETQAMRDLIKKVKPVMYLTFHTYGGLILYPWGFTHDLPPNAKELDSLGNKAAAEIERLFDIKYIVGSSTRVLYLASGGSDDWSMEKAGVPLVYCIELADYGSRFELPNDKLNKVVQHADTLVRVFVKHVVETYGS